MRGLKSVRQVSAALFDIVAPYTGAWIEIAEARRLIFGRIVAPYTGAWIEMTIKNLARIC